MSMGIGGSAVKVMEDAETVIYEYGGYNLNEPRFRNEERVRDGSITITKSCFAEPDIHEKIKKTPGGRKKLVVKRIPVGVDFRKMIKDGLIKVENCGNCWQTVDEVDNADIAAIRVLSEIFQEYQVNGEIPEHISYHT